MVNREIIFFNGQLEMNKEWKRKYVSTFRPLLKGIPALEILGYDVGLRSMVALLIIRVCPTLYPILRSIKRALMNK